VPQVAIKRVDGKKTSTPAILEEVNALSEQIRQRAFESFERRGYDDGSALTDWLQAERELFEVPESELVEREEKFEARLSAPSFEPSEVQIIALPDALIVKAHSSHTQDRGDGDIRFRELEQKDLFRRFDLPSPIDVEQVSAKMDKGILQLTALKSKQADTSGRRTVSA
jgi:HSP20 family protein